MKTKNMRKKALVSSIAMLLVAVVALSGATYAWFTANSAAVVHGMKMQASTSTSLLFSTDSTAAIENWKSDIDFDYSDPMVVVPCSTSNGINLYYVTAGANAAGANTLVDHITGAVSYKDSGTGDKQYIEEVVYCQSGAGGDLIVDTFSFAGTTQNWRFSVQVDSATSAPIYGNGTASLIYNGVTGTSISKENCTFSDLYGTVTTTAGTTTATPTSGTPTTNITAYVQADDHVVIDDMEAGQIYQLTIRAWLEGNTPACNDSLAGQEMSGLSITFGLA